MIKLLGVTTPHVCVPLITKKLAGKCLVFDDCYEHEVWNKTEGERVLLLFDLWHPDLVEEVSVCALVFSVSLMCRLLFA